MYSIKKGNTMKRMINYLSCVVFLLSSLSLAQDIQSIYETAKSALLQGDYQTSLSKIAEAKNQIAADPKLDPNKTFTNKLLTDLEQSAQKVAKIAQAMDDLYKTSVSNLNFTDLPPSLESAEQYTQQAQQFSADLIEKRQELINASDLEPQYREALQKLPALSNLEQLASNGVMAKLSEKYNQIASVYIDSLHMVDMRYKEAQQKIELLLQTSSANKEEMQRLQKELTKLSAERLHYMTAISQMLQGETGSEIEPLRKTLTSEQVQDTFANVIQAEIKRLHGITTVDSAEYKNLAASYERIRNYNLIFYQNNISSDQSALLAQYEAAFKAIKVVEPVRINRTLLIGVILVGIIVFVVTAVIVTKKQKRQTEE
jgi:hypothetical protein